MSVTHIERINLTGGPMDGITTFIECPVNKWSTVCGDRTHTYRRVAETRLFLYEGAEITCQFEQQNESESNPAGTSSESGRTTRGMGWRLSFTSLKRKTRRGWLKFLKSRSGRKTSTV
jgi:hypothetical protein